MVYIIVTPKNILYIRMALLNACAKEEIEFNKSVLYM